MGNKIGPVGVNIYNRQLTSEVSSIYCTKSPQRHPSSSLDYKASVRATIAPDSLLEP